MQAVRWEGVSVERIHDSVARQVIWGERGTMARFQFGRGTHVSPHAHAAEQFTCMVQGEMRIRVGKEEMKLKAGEILVVPPNTEHEVWVLEDAVVLDFFAPARDDWKEGRSHYLAGR